MMIHSDPELVSQLVAERFSRNLEQSTRARLRRSGRRHHTRVPDRDRGAG